MHKRKRPILSIIIVTWNSEEYIDGCLRSVIKTTKTLSSEIIVVDNHSSDDTRKILKTYRNIIFLPQNKNLGFGSANNIGIKRAKGEFLLFLNPDTIINQHALQAMLNFLKNTPDAGIVGPEQHKGDGKIMFTSTKLTPLHILHYFIEKTVNAGKAKERKMFVKPYRTWMVNAGCLLAKRNVFRTPAWFDSKLFVYGEEFDLYDKMRQTQWQVYFLPYCSIVHFRDKSVAKTNKKLLYVVQSFSYLCLKAIQIFISSRLTLPRKPLL